MSPESAVLFCKPFLPRAFCRILLLLSRAAYQWKFVATSWRHRWYCAVMCTWWGDTASPVLLNAIRVKRNIPLLNVLCSLFPSHVQLGELFFPFKFGELFCWGFLRFRVAGALLALHHFITIFSKYSFFLSINKASPRQYLNHSFIFIPMKCICALRSQLSLMWPGFEQLLWLVFQL